MLHTRDMAHSDRANQAGNGLDHLEPAPPKLSVANTPWRDHARIGVSTMVVSLPRDCLAMSAVSCDQTTRPIALITR